MPWWGRTPRCRCFILTAPQVSPAATPAVLPPPGDISPPQAAPDPPQPVAEDIPAFLPPETAGAPRPSPKRRSAVKHSGRRAGHAGAASTREGRGLRNGAASPGTGGPTGGNSNGVGYAYAPLPLYPPEARRQKMEGVVLLAVSIDSHGRPAAVGVEHSSGFALLDQEAVRAVRGWRFKPAETMGAPVACRVEIPVHFRMKDETLRTDYIKRRLGCIHPRR